MKRLVLIVAVALALSCTDESGATSALESQGFTDIRTTGYAGPLSCSKDDFSSTGFRAKNTAGKTVDGVVCCGMVFKSCTVRW